MIDTIRRHQLSILRHILQLRERLVMIERVGIHTLECMQRDHRLRIGWRNEVVVQTVLVVVGGRRLSVERIPIHVLRGEEHVGQLGVAFASVALLDFEWREARLATSRGVFGGGVESDAVWLRDDTRQAGIRTYTKFKIRMDVHEMQCL